MQSMMPFSIDNKNGSVSGTKYTSFFIALLVIVYFRYFHHKGG